MRVVSVVGARPQFIKLSVMIKCIPDDIEHFIVHTGQHYDRALSDGFFDEFSIPKPDINLNVGSNSHTKQTSEIMCGLEMAFENLKPDVVLIYGDTNSTLAGALVAAKMNIPLAHLEAGLRSWNREMPEEINRVVADHLSSLLLVPTASALINLELEGLKDRAVLVGDVMADLCISILDSPRLVLPKPILDLSNDSNYFVATIHRPSNTDNPDRLREIINKLSNLAHPVFLVAHPRLTKLASEANLKMEIGNLFVIPPLSYFEMAASILHSAGIITDSGGLQKEAYIWAKPCTTLRNETEWTETLNNGWNVLSGDLTNLAKNVERMQPANPPFPYFGDGMAGEKIWESLSKLETPKK